MGFLEDDEEDEALRLVVVVVVVVDEEEVARGRVEPFELTTNAEAFNAEADRAKEEGTKERATVTALQTNLIFFSKEDRLLDCWLSCRSSHTEHQQPYQTPTVLLSRLPDSSQQ